MWIYIYGFVCSGTKHVVWFLPDGIDVALFSRILADFAREVGAGAAKRTLLILGEAGWHGLDEVEIPEGVPLEVMPRCLPELQPAERLWPQTNEVVASTISRP